MDLELILKLYNEQKSKIEMLQAGNQVLEDRFLLEVNNKLEHNRCVAQMSLEQFTAHINSMLMKSKIKPVNTEVILGKDYKEVEKRYIFELNDKKKMVVRVQIYVDCIKHVDLKTVGSFSLSILTINYNLTKIKNFKNLADLALYLDLIYGC